MSVDPKTRARLRALAERTLSPEEWAERVAIPVGPEELQQSRELIRWFRRRYPTAGERLAYLRRAYSRWTR
jgi:hypothetical protein